jgi:hypothetical protein
VPALDASNVHEPGFNVEHSRNKVRCHELRDVESIKLEVEGRGEGVKRPMDPAKMVSSEMGSLDTGIGRRNRIAPAKRSAQLQASAVLTTTADKQVVWSS